MKLIWKTQRRAAAGVLGTIMLTLALGTTQAQAAPAASGAWSKASPQAPGVQEAARFAVGRLNMMSADKYGAKLVRVVEAETQLVAGTNYRVQFVMRPTVCTKDRLNEGCAFQPRPAEQRCTAVVYSRPWDNYRELTSYECAPVRTAQGT
ncbi:cystatin family protein [Streptomyces sp. NPDC057910]|uniref:cystatin family protein n=1 Tax=Streptomyces sp. NPDC057910 TaxID=3346278 RepID=UPI0036E319FE